MNLIGCGLSVSRRVRSRSYLMEIILMFVFCRRFVSFGRVGLIAISWFVIRISILEFGVM